MRNGHKPGVGTELLTKPIHVPCAACGTGLGATAKFCPECGTPRVATAAPTTAGEPAAETDSAAITATPIETADAAALPATPVETADAPQVAATSASATEEAIAPVATANVAAEEPLLDPPAAVRWWRRRSTILVVCLALVGGLAYAGVTAFNAFNRRPVIAALVASSQEFSDAVAAMGATENLVAVSETAEEMPGWIRALEAQQDVLSGARASGLRTATSAVIEAQIGYLEALRPLSDVDSTDLSAWSDLSQSLNGATEELRRSLQTLGAVDSAAVADADIETNASTVAIETAVALATADNATLAVGRATDRMGGAVQLADIRAAAGVAEQAAGELQAALETLEGLSDGEATATKLSLQAAFLDELAGLQLLTSENLSAWDAMSASLTDSADEMIAGLELKPADRSALNSELREMRASVAATVTSARKRLAAWRSDVREAEEQRDEELAALSSYESGYRTHMERYNDLRDSTADFTERIRDDYGVTYDEAYTAFYDGISQREGVRDAMNALSPPDSVRSNHLAVVGVIDDAIAAMQAAVDGLADSQFCYYCYYEDTPGWRRFQEESDRITDEFASATSSWDAAISARRAELENLELPERPQI